MMRTYGYTLGIVALAVIGCSATDGPPPDSGPEPMVLEGQVRFLTIEGGCWGLQTDSATYEPVGGFPEDFRQDRLEVRATVRSVHGGSICMIGPLVEIVTIEPVTPSQ